MTRDTDAAIDIDRTDKSEPGCVFDTGRELTRAERHSLHELIWIANAHLIDQDYSRQAAIDALSIASVLVSEDDPDSFGIAPGNVPESALPPSYNTKTGGDGR